MKKLYPFFILYVFLNLINAPSYAQTWDLVWSDEFDYTGLPNTAKWSYDVGGGGWGNNELEYYTSARLENAMVDNGILTINAIKESYGGKNYTSARLVTKNKGDWTYGRFEIRAKLPAGRGSWPAIWMLPTSSSYGSTYWPDNGEIDIMEHVGYDPGKVHGTVHTNNHYGGNGRGAATTVSDFNSAFHTYILEWSADRMDFFVDETKYFTLYNQSIGWTDWPFDKPFHILLNVAVGGNWGGAQGVDDNIFPIKMDVDYVRVYKKSTAVNDLSNDLVNSVKLFPNPAKDSFNIQMNSNVTGKALKIKVFDSKGVEVFSKDFKSFNEPVDINFKDLNFAPGIYFVNLLTDKGTINKKLIIK